MTQPNTGSRTQGRRRPSDGTGTWAAGEGVRDAFLPALCESCNRMNTPGGGYQFGGNPEGVAHAARARFVAGESTRLLLAADGFYALVSDYGRYTLQALMEAAVSKGLAMLAGELGAVETADPEVWHFPRFKCNDDGTALLLGVTGWVKSRAAPGRRLPRSF